MAKSLLYKSAFVLAVSSLASRLLGILRDHLLARYFGVGGEGVFNLDVYYAAFRVPDFIFAVLVMGTISAAFVPLLTEQLKGERVFSEDTSKFVSNVLTTLVMLVGGLALFAAVFAPALVGVLVPGFTGENFELTVTLTRIMLLSPILFSVSSVLQAVQNTFDRFFYYALAPIVYNVGIVLGILFFAREHGVHGVVVGVLVGAFMHMLVQIPGLKGLDWSFRPYFEPSDVRLRKMIKLVLPRIVGVSVMQINLVFDTLVGSLLAAGSITVLNYAANLNSLPMGMVGVSFAVASFASLSGLAYKVNSSNGLMRKKALREFGSRLGEVISSVLFFVLPLGVGLFVLRFEVIDLILHSGAFTPEDSYLTAQTLGFFLIGLIGQSLIPVCARAFYAFQNTVIPVGVSIFSMVLNIGLNFYFALNLEMGVYGVALATSIASLVNLALLLLFLRFTFLKTVPFLQLKKLTILVISAGLMGYVVSLINIALVDFAAVSFTNKMLALSASILSGALVYAVLCMTFRVEEFRVIYSKLFKKN